MRLLLPFFYLLGVVAVGAVYDNPRLPKALKPLHYEIRVLTFLHGDKNEIGFGGQARIILEAHETTNQIVLHAKNLFIDESLIELNEGKINITATEVNQRFSYFIIHSAESLVKGERYVLDLPFFASFSDEPKGYYADCRDSCDKPTKRWIAVTQFERNDARLAFPCFDEPAMRATFRIILGHHKNFTSLSNTKIEETQPCTEYPNFIWSKYEVTPLMPTYLVAYAVHDFRAIKSTTQVGSNQVEFRTWAHPNSLKNVAYAAEKGPQILTYFEKLFKLDYPMTIVDQLAMQKFAYGGMENWGLVVYGENSIFYNKTNSLQKKKRVAELVAHELAHYWFGDMVTVSWWNDNWLKEGFATYFSVVGVDGVHPEWQYGQTQYLFTQNLALTAEDKQKTPPLSHTIESESVAGSDSVIDYKKACSVIRMVHSSLGDEAFYSGLRSYLRVYAYSSTKQDQLFSKLQEGSDKFNALPKGFAVKTIMDTWTLQSGYPVVFVERNYETNTVTITQKPSAKAGKGCWWVPLTYTTQVEADFNNTKTKSWLKCNSKGVAEPLQLKLNATENEWIVFNIQSVGYYRVQYDQRNWELLQGSLKIKGHGGISVINRAKLISDINAQQMLNTEQFLEFLSYLRLEQSYEPWKALGTLFLRLDGYNLDRAKISHFMKDLVEFVYKKLDTFSNEDVIWQIEFFYQCFELVGGDCIELAEDYLDGEETKLETNRSGTSPSFSTAVICASECFDGQINQEMKEKLSKLSWIDEIKSNCRCSSKVKAN